MRSHKITHSIMLDMVIAMLPVTAFGAYHFGMHVSLVLIVTAAVCALSEYVYEKLMEKPNTISDCNALVTGLILALNTPPEIPVWIPALGGVFVIIVVKQLYGGLGQNFMNPAPAARYSLLTFFAGKIINSSYNELDGVSGATLLAVLKSGGTVNVPAMLVGNIPGIVGEVSVIVLPIDAVYPLAKKVTFTRVLGTYILTVVVFAALFGGHGFDLNYIAAHLCGGGLIFGALFMATDYVTSPITPKDQIVPGILLGVLTRLFRILGGSAEGVPYAVTIGNIPVPLIEKATFPKAFGKEGK